MCKILEYAALSKRRKAVQFKLVFLYLTLSHWPLGQLYIEKSQSITSEPFPRKSGSYNLAKRLRSIAPLRALDRLRSSSTKGFCDEFEENHQKVSWNVFNTPRARTFDFPALFKTLVNESVDFVTVLFTSIFSLS